MDIKSVPKTANNNNGVGQALTAEKQTNRSEMVDTESNPVLQRNLSKSNRFDLKDKDDSNTGYNLQV